MQPIQLWPVLFYDFQWEDHAMHADRLRAVCYDLEQRKQTSGVAVDAKGGLYESDFDFLKQADASVQALANWINQCFFRAAAAANKQYWAKGMNIQLNVHESWCHITRDGGYHDMHTHPGSSWSAIYYLDTGDMDKGRKNGVNRFFCPYHSMYIDAGTAWTAANTSVDFVATPGMMIVFPSWIQHNAVTYRGSQDRIVIAANCKINNADLVQ